MPLNLLKKYPDLLEINHLNQKERLKSLRRVFDRDISNNGNFQLRSKQIHPTTQDGQDPLDILFKHLTTIDEKDDDGKKTGKRIFESDRSVRLHWIKHHIEENTPSVIHIFSYEDRIDRTDQIRTYIFDESEKHVIILEPFREKEEYYLLTAYYLNKSYGEKQIRKKMKKKLPKIH